MPSAEVTLKQGVMITRPELLLEVKKAEIEEGNRVLAELEKIDGISKHKISRVKGRIHFLEKFTRILQDGYLPIPRMEYERLESLWTGNIVLDQMPVEAIATVAEFQDKFDRLGMVRPKTQGRRRDPFLIGIISYGGIEEHFILAWWRPDLMLPSQLW